MHRVLIVDDIELNRMLLAGNLSGLKDVETLEAENGIKALEMMGAHDVDLVLLDLQMPELDGFGLLQAMQADEKLRNIPVVIQSELNDDQSIRRGLELGAHDYLVRTTDGDALRRDLALKVRNAVAAYSAYKEARNELAERKLAEQRLAVSRRRRQLSDLFVAFLAGRVAFAQLSRQMQLLGSEPAYPLRIYIIAVESVDGRNKKEIQERPAEWQVLEDGLLDRLEANGGGIAWPHDDHIVLLRVDKEPLAQMERWKAEIGAALPQVKLQAAASGICRDASEIASGYRQARDTLHAVRCNEKYAGAAAYESIGADRILVPLADRPESDEYVRSALQPLVDYDRQQDSELVDTLEALLWMPELSLVAKSMGIHLKTVQFRRKRIQEILGVNLGDADTRLTLSIAVRLSRLKSR